MTDEADKASEWTPERPNSPWATKTPWVEIGQEERSGKVCTSCGQRWPADCFVADRSRKDGLTYNCKLCRQRDWPSSSRFPFLYERIMAKVGRNRLTGCWVWLGAVNDRGYGQLRIHDRVYYTHRLVYAAHHGTIPSGFHVDHLCPDKSCCNPSHLEAVQPAENARRARRMHCKRGHPLWGENVQRITTRPGKRVCRACRKIREARYV